MNDQNRQRAGDVLVHEVSPSESTSEAVVAAVATAADVRAVESTDGTGDVLDPLYDVVDPDALDALFGQGVTGAGRIDGEVRFTYHEQLVRVRSDGLIVVEPVAPTVDETPSV